MKSKWWKPARGCRGKPCEHCRGAVGVVAGSGLDEVVFDMKFFTSNTSCCEGRKMKAPEQRRSKPYSQTGDVALESAGETVEDVESDR